jgi:hypothetical protein
VAKAQWTASVTSSGQTRLSAAKMAAVASSSRTSLRAGPAPQVGQTAGRADSRDADRPEHLARRGPAEAAALLGTDRTAEDPAALRQAPRDERHQRPGREAEARQHEQCQQRFEHVRILASWWDVMLAL